jgi:hypothetical protein
VSGTTHVRGGRYKLRYGTADDNPDAESALQRNTVGRPRVICEPTFGIMRNVRYVYWRHTHCRYRANSQRHISAICTTPHATLARSALDQRPAQASHSIAIVWQHQHQRYWTAVAKQASRSDSRSMSYATRLCWSWVRPVPPLWRALCSATGSLSAVAQVSCCSESTSRC